MQLGRDMRSSHARPLVGGSVGPACIHETLAQVERQYRPPRWGSFPAEVEPAICAKHLETLHVRCRPSPVHQS